LRSRGVAWFNDPDSTYAACVERLEIVSPKPVPPFLRVMASLADP
jgi:hypothetical protein